MSIKFLFRKRKDKSFLKKTERKIFIILCYYKVKATVFCDGQGRIFDNNYIMHRYEPLENRVARNDR